VDLPWPVLFIPVPRLSAADGFLYYVLINLTMRLTDEDGGYVNPTITLSLAWLDTWFQWRQSWKFMLRALFLIVMQLAGAIGGTDPSPSDSL